MMLQYVILELITTILMTRIVVIIVITMTIVIILMKIDVATTMRTTTMLPGDCI